MLLIMWRGGRHPAGAHQEGAVPRPPRLAAAPAGRHPARPRQPRRRRPRSWCARRSSGEPFLHRPRRGGHPHQGRVLEVGVLAAGPRGEAADLALAFIDGPSRTSGFGPTITATRADVVADMDQLRAFYADKRGIHPELRHRAPAARGAHRARRRPGLRLTEATHQRFVHVLRPALGCRRRAPARRRRRSSSRPVPKHWSARWASDPAGWCAHGARPQNGVNVRSAGRRPVHPPGRQPVGPVVVPGAARSTHLVHAARRRPGRSRSSRCRRSSGRRPARRPRGRRPRRCRHPSSRSHRVRPAARARGRAPPTTPRRGTVVLEPRRPTSRARRRAARRP